MRLSIIFILLSSFAYSQQSQKKIAYKYYLNAEYYKAVDIYEKIFKNNFSVTDYNPYLNSLFNIQDYQSAEELAKQGFKKYPKNLNYLLVIAISQEKRGILKKSSKNYSTLFDKMSGQASQTLSLANILKNRGLNSKALKIYQIAEEKNNKIKFRTQKAETYLALGNIDLMIELLLEELLYYPSKKKLVIQKIQRFLNNNGIKNEDNYKLVKKYLLPYVKSEVERTDFSELLIWVFMQNEQFNMALRYAKALDRRIDSDGIEVYDMGDYFLDNEKYELAIEAYNYIISKGDNNFLYISSCINNLYCLTMIAKEDSDFNKIDNIYSNAIEELGFNQNTVLLLSNYAHFKAFYLDDLISAKEILESAMKIPQISDKNLAECKLEYADVMLMLGNTWDALLYYSQVEKSFKEDPIGHEAKLRAAKISYYQGDFEWAQSQLEILKSSTSKLIANDAMKLSLIIIDNLNMDTTNTAMEIFAYADLCNYQQKYHQSLLNYDSILSFYPSHSLTDEIYMLKAEIYKKLNNFTAAVEMYNLIINEWKYDILVDDAIYNLAKLYDYELDEKLMAKSMYELLIKNHSSSIFVAESRKRYREIRGDEIN